jgi:hypothetical protein
MKRVLELHIELTKIEREVPQVAEGELMAS